MDETSERASPQLSYAPSAAPSPWATYLAQIDRVIPYLGDLARWAETLKHPKRMLIVDVPIEMDNGMVRHFEGFRVQHNLLRGPGKGGSSLMANQKSLWLPSLMRPAGPRNANSSSLEAHQ